MNIVVAGIMGRYPYGGVSWCSLMYLMGLRDLGHNVWYLEDTGECNYDPVTNARATDPSYAVDLIRRNCEAFGFDGRWCYVDYLGNRYGQSEREWKEICAAADLFLNLSGGSWFWRDEYQAIPRSAFIDSDPAFTQLALAQGVPWYVDFFGEFDRLFTFGRNIGTPECAVPTGPFTWTPTWQPVCLDQWASCQPPSGAFRTIMTWVIESFDDIGGNKNVEFEKVLDLPSATSLPFEIALNGTEDQLPDARALLRRHGWTCHDAFSVSRDIDGYRDYIRQSMAEFSVAKHTYVATNSGWFSDRTECFLAAGRPAVVQATGFERHLPTGTGLLAFSTYEDAVAAVDAVASDPVMHGRAAVEIARAYFDARVVLPDLLDAVSSDACAPETSAS